MDFTGGHLVFCLFPELSGELQEALGVTDKSLPPFIYRMRQLGYPPGWLKEAEMEYSGLALYDGKGKERAVGMQFSICRLFAGCTLFRRQSTLVCKLSSSSWKSEKVVNQIFFSKVM